MKDKRLNALITLVEDWLPCLMPDDRRQFLQELRCGWCERCGHSENAMCKEGKCS